MQYFQNYFTLYLQMTKVTIQKSKLQKLSFLFKPLKFFKIFMTRNMSKYWIRKQIYKIISFQFGMKLDHSDILIINVCRGKRGSIRHNKDFVSLLEWGANVDPMKQLFFVLNNIIRHSVMHKFTDHLIRLIHIAKH